MDTKVYGKSKALRLAAGPAGDAARAKRKLSNANEKSNPKNNGKVKERARANAETRIRLNPIIG